VKYLLLLLALGGCDVFAVQPPLQAQVFAPRPSPPRTAEDEAMSRCARWVSANIRRPQAYSGEFMIMCMNATPEEFPSSNITRY
jgi:hypothetical protein